MTAQVAANVTENLNASTTTTTSTNEKTINNQLGTIVKLKIIHGKNKYNVEIGLENTGKYINIYAAYKTIILLYIYVYISHTWTYIKKHNTNNHITNKRHIYIYIYINTVDDLKIHLETLTNVDRSMQKLMFKGALKQGTLSENKIKNKSKLKLIGNPMDQVMQIVHNTQVDADKATNDKILGFEQELKKEKDDDGDTGPWKDMKEHKKILDMGVPEGTGAGNKSIRLRLPSSPLLVRGMDGQPVRIVFRMQITPPQVWLQSVTRTKKIPLGQVHSIKCEDIEDGNYVIMALQLGKTSKSRVYLYFVPKQYVESLKTEIIGYRP